MKMRAPSSGCPTRDTELLIADPRPEYRPGTHAIRALVRGATTHDSPIPNVMAYGRMSVKTLVGGTRLAGFWTDAFHGSESAGRRAYQRTATAMSDGPISRKRLAPIRPAIVPILVDSTASS